MKQTVYIFSQKTAAFIYLKTQNLLKKIKLISQPLFPPAQGRDGTFYCCFKDRTIRAYNRGGMHLWIKKLPAAPVLPPFVNSRGNLVIFLSDSTAVSFALNGRLRWRKDASAVSGIMPVSFSRGIIFNSEGRYKYLTDRGNTVNIPQQSDAESFLYSGGNLFISKKNSSYNSADYILSSLDSSLNLKWSIPLEGRPAEIKRYGKYFFVLTDRGYFYKTDLNGSLIKQQKAASGGYSNFTVLDNYIYLVSSAGYVKLYSHDLVFKDKLLFRRKQFRV